MDMDMDMDMDTDMDMDMDYARPDQHGVHGVSGRYGA